MDTKEYQRQWVLANRAKVNAAAKRYRDKNKEKIANNTQRKEYMKEYAKEYYLKNKEKVDLKNKQHYENNKSYYVAKTRKYQAAKLQRTPAWLDATDYFEMECVYLYCAALRSCGLDYHVDHIEPLQGKDRSGLHVPSNLQVIPAEQNLRKSNSATIS